MATRRSSQLTIGYSPVWKRQAAWNTPVSGSDLTRAFPATSREYIDTDETTEDIMDCTGEDFLFELLTGAFARLNLEMDFDPDVFAGLLAGGMGVATAPTGGTNEVQTEVMTANGGTRRLTFQKGADAQTTPELAYNETAANIEDALEALSNVGVGNVTVVNTGNASAVHTETLTADGGTRRLGYKGQWTSNLAWNAADSALESALEGLSTIGAGNIVVAGSGPYTYTFAGDLANTDVDLLDVDDALLEDGGAPGTGSSVIAETTPGSTGSFVYTFGGALGNQAIDMMVVNGFNLEGGTSVISETTPGVGMLHAISRTTGYTLPLFTFYIGFRGSDKQPVIFKNVIVNSITVRSASRERVTATVELIGSAELNDAIGYVMPPCTDIIPLRFGDCKMSVNGVDYIAAEQGREFEWTYSNDVTPRFDGAGIYSTRHERADSRPTQFSYFILGEPGDPLWDLAKMRQSFVVFLQLGPDQRHVRINAPQCFVKLASTPIRFGGDPPESELAIVGRPRKVSGDVTTPVTGQAVIAQSVAMLGT